MTQDRWGGCKSNIRTRGIADGRAINLEAVPTSPTLNPLHENRTSSISTKTFVLPGQESANAGDVGSCATEHLGNFYGVVALLQVGQHFPLPICQCPLPFLKVDVNGRGVTGVWRV